ncbi:hypothetical protein [Collimonas humicola]|uniref:hypothetical protein n=1 Tax=Collimonas humicola TaxID=2825886 RepID=UPI001B8C482A|nr:hypothetical protein [Collimonas humicola]
MTDSTQLFKNSHEALTFAFNYSSQQYALSPMSKLMTAGAIGSGKGLVSQDGAGQAGFIMAEVGRLEPLHRACITARYSARFSDCPCCGHANNMTQEYKEAIVALREWSTSLFAGLSLRNARELVVRAYFERDLKVQAIADRVKIPKRTLYDNKAKIWAGLNKLDHAALVAIDVRLQKFVAPKAKIDSEKRVA